MCTDYTSIWREREQKACLSIGFSEDIPTECGMYCVKIYPEWDQIVLDKYCWSEEVFVRSPSILLSGYVYNRSGQLEMVHPSSNSDYTHAYFALTPDGIEEAKKRLCTKKMLFKRI
jgi:hypothetical protein